MLRARSCVQNIAHVTSGSERASTAAFSMLISLSIFISSSFALSRSAWSSSLYRHMQLRTGLSTGARAVLASARRYAPHSTFFKVEVQPLTCCQLVNLMPGSAATTRVNRQAFMAVVRDLVAA